MVVDVRKEHNESQTLPIEIFDHIYEKLSVSICHVLLCRLTSSLTSMKIEHSLPDGNVEKEENPRVAFERPVLMQRKILFNRWIRVHTDFSV